MPNRYFMAIIIAAAAGLAGCRQSSQLHTVADFAGRQCTGVAVSADGRVFVNFPRWSPNHGASVVEVLPDGSQQPYPNVLWNQWDAETDPRERFVCVQSVWADTAEAGSPLWVLDPGSPQMEGVVPGAAKLVQIDLAKNLVMRTIRFDSKIAPTDSYLNDVRVDSRRGFAYITDSGRGALVVVNLNNGRSRRVLDGHPSTQAEADVSPVIGGRAWQASDGAVPQVHADGIALSRDGEQLYFKALTGRTLYRIPTVGLRNFSLPDSLVEQSVESLGRTVVSDGMLMDAAGRVHLTDLETGAVVAREADGTLQTVIADPSLAWPDSLAISPEGDLYITVSQIHLLPKFNDGASRRTAPYRLFKLPKAAAAWPKTDENN